MNKAKYHKNVLKFNDNEQMLMETIPIPLKSQKRSDLTI